MEPMKLDIQMFAPDVGTVDINVNFKDISEDELPESFVIALDAEEVTIPISGLSTNYVWNHSGTFVFDTISIVTEGYSIIAYQIGNGIINIDVYKNNAFTRKIIDDNAINQSEPNFSQVATTDEGMFTANDNDGVTAYFRGAVTNNYVKFANFWWRIIRVNGNGSVRLIYDGTTAHSNGESSTDRHIGTSAFNTNNNDNAYVGYMYGTPGSTTYDATHANVNNSAVKTTLDNWYESNLSNYSNYIDTEVGFWGDRTAYSGTGLGTKYTTYGSLVRLDNNKTPTFEYNNSNDLYTTSGSSQGNKVLQYPIGLITADEVAYAGGVHSWNNTRYYLYAGQDYYWTMSPYHYSGIAYVYSVYSTGALAAGSNVDWAVLGVRPVINLRGDLSVTGTGISTNPYEVSIVPATIFNGTELTNIYYNGTEISKMYCNGVLVFEKGPSVVYKRRIMVGDNLKGMTVYNDFYSGYYNNFTKPTGGAIVLPMKLVTVNYETTGMAGDLSGISYYEGSGTITINSDFLEAELYYYNWYTGVERIGGTLTYPTDKDYLVTEVDDIDKSYRHLYIEDPNIRPIQVGDKIIEGTQLYFNFPDNPDSWLTGKYGCDVIKCGDKTIMYYATEQPVSRAVSAISSIRLESNDMYEFDLSTLEISRNLSSYIIKFYYQDAVSYVDDKFQQYILVDTTTLGV